MADNIDLPGAGKTVATDEVDSKHYQKIKPTFGPDGTVPTPVSPDDPLPVASGLAIPQHDTVSLVQSTTTDTYTYTRTGATVGTLTVTFTDSTKLTLSSAVLS